MFAIGASVPSGDWVADFRDDYELIRQWGQVCRRTFRWQPSWGDWQLVYTGKHPTPEAANAEARRMALAAGYRAPKWWEFWRFSEEPLPEPPYPERD